MKKIIWYAAGFTAVSLLFCVCYYASYKNALQDFNRKAQEQENSLYTELVRVSEENKALLNQLAQREEERRQEEQQELRTDTLETGLTPKNTVLPTVTYIEETYDLTTGLLESEMKTAPGFLIGMTREELTEYIRHYMDNLSLAEYEAGLSAYEVVSFSENRVVLRKTYNAEKVPYKYYVNISDGMVIVYYSDLKSVFEYTHIPAVDLAEDVRLSLIKGIYVKDREELYSLLESFSS